MASETVMLTEAPSGSRQSFLDFPLLLDTDSIHAHFAILGIPFGMPYHNSEWPNDQSRAPDALRSFATSEDVAYTKNHHDFDLDGPLLDNRDINVIDCGNVTADHSNPGTHYQRAEAIARKIFSSGAILISIGGDHGVPIPVMRALEVIGKPVTLVHVDGHLDWRQEVNGETEGYSSPIRRASEMPWINDIVQIGMRGIGSARQTEVADARNHGCKIIDAYQMHHRGMDQVLSEIPDGGPYYLSIDADGLDPTIMPGVIAQTPGGLNWLQIRQLVHGLVKKGLVVGMDLVEIAPSFDVGNTTLIHAERLICNFIGASVRAGHAA